MAQTLYMNLMGGFGNILFQYMYGYTIAKKCDFKLELYCPVNSKIYPAAYTFLKNYTILKTLPVNTVKINEPTFCYTPINYNQILKKGDLFINGYFQSYKYSDEYFDEIKKNIFEILNHKISNVENIISKLNLKTTICVHFRRTDYLKYADVHHIIKDDSWYFKAIEKLLQQLNLKKDEITLIIFSDDIEYIKKHALVLMYPSIIAEEYNLDTEEIFIWMSNCDHFIIPNSTYSLMAYYFRKNKDSKIIIPNKWFGFKGPSHKMDDLIEMTNNVVINSI